MIYILSKLLSFLLLPLLYVFVSLSVALFAKKQTIKRKSLIILIVILYIFSAPVFLNVFVNLWNIAPGKLATGKVYSTAIILGGFSGDDGKGNGRFNWAADRFIQGVMLQRTGKVKKILVSGGNGNFSPNTFREADWVKEQLINMKVPDTCIIVEDKSRNTIENALLTKALLLKNYQQGPYLLVTSAFHMRRSMQIFKSKGINVIPWPCNYMSGAGGFSVIDLVPSTETLNTWSLYIKEIVGVAVNCITGKV